MKEAAGEANLTVIAIILIGVVAAVVTPLVNSYLKSAAKKSCCTNAGGIWKNNACQEVSSASGTYKAMVESTYWNANERVCVDK